MRLVFALLFCALFFCVPVAWPVQAQSGAPSDDALRSRLDSLIQERARLQQQIVGLEQAITDVGREISRRAYERLAAQGVELQVQRSGWLRSAPFASADSVIEVPQDMRLKASGYDRGFWHVEYRDTSGYLSDVLVAENPLSDVIKSSALSSPAEPAADVRPEADSEVAPLPESRPRLKSSERVAAVQCAGITKKGARCKRTTTHPSGFCYQHRD